jgi:transcriptional regulator with XRE-family HTH domain
VDTGRRLTLLREVFGLSQTAFGKVVGLSQSRYSQYETGERLLPVQVAIAVSNEFGVTLDWLYTGEPNAMPMDLWRKIRKLADEKDPAGRTP